MSWSGYGDLSWSDLPAYRAEAEAITEAALGDLSDYDWVDDAQDEIDELIDSDVAFLGYLYQCANAPGTSDAQSSIVEALTDAGNRSGEAASAARFALGLPIERE